MDPSAIKLVAFTDYVYHRDAGRVYAERAFAMFLAGLAEQVQQLTIVGRLAPTGGRSHYSLPPAVRFVELPHYADLSHPGAVAGSLLRSLRRFWTVLEDADHVWLLGPYPHALAFAALTLARRRGLILGVRQDFPVYVRSRRRQRWMHLAADALEGAWRLLARIVPVVVVGPELARQYAHAPAVLDLTVSLITEADVEAGRQTRRDYGRGLTILSVGRLDREKNPLLLADVLDTLRTDDPRWRLLVCGEGPMAQALAERLRDLGLSEHAEVRGYIPLHGGLLDLYRQAHAFLHVSLTEGMPQVLTEAFASALPVVATAVGGVAEAAGDAALLIQPDDAAAAVAALRRIATEPDLRRRLVAAGLERVRGRTLQSQTHRVANFIAAV